MTTAPFRQRGVRERTPATVAPPTMTNPRRYLVRQVAFTLAVLLVTAVLYAQGPLEEAYLANPILNGFILIVMVLGIFYSMRQVQRLQTEVRWIESYRRNEIGRAHV